MAGVDGLGLILFFGPRRTSLADTLGTAGEELKGTAQAAGRSKTETFFYCINIKILYMNKNEACSTEDFKASKNIPSALAKGNTARLSMESIIVHGGVQGGRSA